MFLLNKPTKNQIRHFLAQQRNQGFSYAEAGSLQPPLRGYKNDYNRVRLGEGSATFQNAVEAVRSWQMFNIGWLQLCWPDAPIEVGSTVAVLARHFGFWSMNACRIARVIIEDGPVRKFGFAYGTLPDHVERGEESFTIEWRREDDSVWYDIFAYSRPNHFLAKVGYPLTRALQKRFARDSMEAMLRGSASC